MIKTRIKESEEWGFYVSFPGYFQGLAGKHDFINEVIIFFKYPVLTGRGCFITLDETFIGLVFHPISEIPEI